MDLFGTAGVRGDATAEVTPRLALALGRAAGLDARAHGVTTVVLGRDGRVTGPGIAAAVESGLLSGGVDVRRLGVVPTPTLAFASRGRRGVMVTASHNPPGDAGLKLFDDGVEFDAEAEARIERRVGEDAEPVDWRDWGEAADHDALRSYRAAVVDYASRVGRSLAGLAVAVDCGNGTAGRATPQVLARLGADVTAVNANVDGHFPGRPSEPTAESLSAFVDFVGDGPHALGFAQDGDADRVVVVDGDGALVPDDTVTAILAERFVALADAETPVVVTTPNASSRIDERVRAAGGRTRRVALGSLHEGVAAARAAGVVVALAAEPSKHLHPGLGGWIDGIASAAVIARLVAEAGGLDPLRAPIVERPYRTAQVACPDADKPEVMTRVTDRLPGRFPAASVETAHGVRLEGDGWWLLVRPSGTEPLVRIYAEGEDADGRVAAAREVVSDAVPTP